MELYLVKTTEGNFIPAYNSDHELAQKIKPGEIVKSKITRPRNVEFHRKFYALLNLGFSNQEQIEDFESFRALIIMKAGFYKRIVSEKGEFFLPKSISFAKMDDIEFADLYSKTLDVMLKLLDTTKEDLEMELINFM